jgi:RNA polymerase sigma-70 factor (ECF subfamily)
MISYNSEDYKVMIGESDDYTPADILSTQYIQNLISNLDEDISKPFMMHVDGFKYHEIAEEMDLPLGTVKSRIHQTRKILSSQLQND